MQQNRLGYSGIVVSDLCLGAMTFGSQCDEQHDFVASTIVGASHEDHLDAIIAAAEVILDDEILKKIDQVSKGIPYPMG